MSAVDPATLGTYLGITDLDEARAALLITQSVLLVRAITGPVDLDEPVPDYASAVILSSVARAYLNPSGASNQSAGPYSVAIPSGGVYLTRAERATLGRLSGDGQHFGVDMIPGYEDPT